MQRVQSWFQIKPDEDGKLPRIIPAFNYMEVLKPMTPKDARLHLGAVEPDDDSSSFKDGGSKSNSSNSGGVQQDDVPF